MHEVRGSKKRRRSRRIYLRHFGTKLSRLEVEHRGDKRSDAVDRAVARRRIDGLARRQVSRQAGAVHVAVVIGAVEVRLYDA